MHVAAGLLAVAVVGKTSLAWGQLAVRDQSGTLTATASSQQTQAWLQQRFAGSFVDVTTYSATSTFYTSGYRDPYVSTAIFLRPSYQLGTRFKLSLNGRMFIEEEFTTPDTPNARRFYPSDASVSLNAKNLYTMPRAKVTFSGSTSATLPVSWESQYAHLVTSLGFGLNAFRPWEFGRPDAQGKRWQLTVTLGESFSKAFRTSAIRGNSPGDTTGCRETGTLVSSSAAYGPADTDHCGGPLSTSYTISTSGSVALSHGRYSATIGLSVINAFKYSVDPSVWGSALDTMNTIPAGRTDTTWGNVSVEYEYSDHLSFSLGVTSRQPALDSRYQNLRFPWWDFSGGNANQYTQIFLGATGIL